MSPQFIFIYCSENKALANKFAGDLASSGASFIHVQADLQSDFTEVANSTKPAILLVTDNFLKNKNCLNRAYANYSQLIKSGRLMAVLADGHTVNSSGLVVTAKTQIERVSNIIYYMNHWQELYLQERKKLGLGQSTEEDVNVVKNIAAEISDFIRNIKESNFQNFENLTARNYQQFCQIAGLPMPTTNLELEAIAPVVETVQIVENEPVAIVEENKISEIEIPEPENFGAIEPIQLTEEEEIDTILDAIPGINLLSKSPISTENRNAVREIDEDDFFNEPLPMLNDSNISEIMEEVVAEEGNEFEKTELTENAEIEDIFGEDNEDIDDLFDNITNSKSDIIEEMPSEVVGESTDSQIIIESKAVSDPEETLLLAMEEKAVLHEIEIDEDDDDFIRENVTAAEEPITDESFLKEIEEAQALSTYEIEEQLGIISSISEDNRSSKDRLKSALDYAKQQNFGAAMVELEAVLAENPNNPDAYFLLAEVSELNQDYISALSFYEKVADISPYYPSVFQKLGQLSAAHYPEERKQTKKYFKKAIDLDENNADLLYAYAEFLNEDEKNIDKAIKYFKRTLKQNENHQFANYDLAMIYHNAGEHSLANEYYELACEINPELATPENDNAFNNYHVLDIARAGEAINLHNIEAEEQLQPIDNEQFEEKVEEKIEEVLDLTPPVELVIIQENIIPVIEPAPLLEVHEPEMEVVYTPKINKYKPQGDAKIVLITGATAGIGKATAEIFASHGYNLILTGRREERLISLQNEFHEKYTGGCIILNFDVRNLQNIQTTFDNLDKSWKNIDILVNNAGLALGMDPIHEGSIEHWDAMIDTNVKGLLYMTRLISPQMVARQTGHIINICSTAGKEAYPNGNVYCATKFAVEALTRSTRIDLHKFGIRVGQVSPGAVEETEFSEVRFEGNKDRAAKIYEGFLPLRAADVADVIYYMASAPSHVNIQDVLVMGTQQASATIIDRSGR